MIPIVIVLILGFAVGLKANRGPGGTAARLLTNYSGVHKAQLHDAYSLLVSGNYAQAATLAASVKRNDPDNPLAWHIIGLADAHRGLTEEAAINFERACELNPDFHEAWFSLGIVDENRGEYARALAAFRAAAEIEPDKSMYRDAVERMVGIVMGDTGWELEEAQAGRMFLSGIDAVSSGTPDDLDYAETIFRSLLLDRPYDVAGRNMLGLTLTRLGKFDEAEQHFIRVVNEEPGFADGWFNLGMLHRSQGRLEEALLDFETARNSSSLDSFRAATMREIEAVRAILATETPLPPPVNLPVTTAEISPPAEDAPESD